jgi:hypothetical protein
MNYPNTIRFWENINGANVRLELLDGHCHTHTRGGDTEEGYSYTEVTWTYEGGNVIREASTRACDCDGRIDVQRTMVAPHDATQQMPWSDKPTLRYTTLKQRQRDYSAEAMNY